MKNQQADDDSLKPDKKIRITNRFSMDDMFKTRDSTNYPAVSRNKRCYSTKNINNNSQFKSSTGFSRTMTNKIRGFGMSDLHSSNTLQNSVYSWSFGKSQRFIGLHRKTFSDVFYNLPRFKSDKIATLGYGERHKIISNTGKDSPPPNSYKIMSSVDFNKLWKKGPILGEKIKLLDPTNINYPGPGAYTLSKDFWKEKQANQLKSRVMYFYDEDLAKQKHCISPQKYLPSTKIQQSWRFNKITFGVGGRSTKDKTSMSKNPGPGTYMPPSVFDKKRRYKTPLN